MNFLRLLRKHKVLAALVAIATLCLAGNAVSNAATGAATITPSIVNNNIAVIIGADFKPGTPVTITVTAGTPLAPLSATPRTTDGGFVTNTFLPDGYSGPVSIIAKQGTVSATGSATATGTGSASPAASPPVDTSAGAASTGTTSTPAKADPTVSQQGSAAATTPAAAAGAGATAGNPSGGGTAAATAAWGAPVKEYDWATAGDLGGFNPYDNGDSVDFGLKRASNCSVAGGLLTLKGETDGHTCGGDFDLSQEHGRWEARTKATHDKACWRPVMLLWPDNGSDSDVGEFDYSESDGSLSKVDFFLHTGHGDEQVNESVDVDQGQWHNYAVEWEADHVTGYVDGKQFFSETDASKIPTSPFHETFQLDAQDGDGLCDGNTTWQVDWLKVYKG